jgi:hypothetical protein
VAHSSLPYGGEGGRWPMRHSKRQGPPVIVSKQLLPSIKDPTTEGKMVMWPVEGAGEVQQFNNIIFLKDNELFAR